jgi:hypothetical protein
MDNEVVIKWVWKDIQSLRPKLSRAQCIELLDEISKGLHDRSVELGWEIMETLIQMNTEEDDND